MTLRTRTTASFSAIALCAATAGLLPACELSGMATFGGLNTGGSATNTGVMTATNLTVVHTTPVAPYSTRTRTSRRNGIYVAGSRPSGAPAAPVSGTTPAPATQPGQPTSGQPSSGDAIPTVSQPTLFGDNNADPNALMGEVYFVAPGTKSIPDFNQLGLSGVLYTSSLNIPPNNFTSGFPGIGGRSDWFAIRYEGPLTVTTPAIYDLRLLSDDGAISMTL
jgi:hypothetical protein